MAELTKYNTLAEAIAFNLSKEQLAELGLLDYAGFNKYAHRNGITTKLYPNKLSQFRKGLFDEIKSNSNFDYKTLEFDTNDNIVKIDSSVPTMSYFKKNTIREIDLTNQYKFGYSDNIALSSLNGTIINLYSNLFEMKINHFGNFDKNKYDTALYNNYKDYFKNHLNLRNRLGEDGTFYYKPLSDFRYLTNKKVIKVSELLDNSFFNMINLIPNNTIGFIYKDINRDGSIKTNNKYDEFCNDIETNYATIISSYDNLKAFEEKYYQSYTIYFRSSNVVYFGAYGDLSIMAMFVNDNKLDYPLNKNGYIDYDAIDYSKEYTSGLGAAKVNPKIITKMLGWSWTKVGSFTNIPKNDTQGIASKISITNQIFRPSDNTATLTVTLGHTIVDGVTYNDELQSIYSSNSYINIVNNNDGTYTISFRNTTTPQTDILYIPIKNTFTGIVTDNFFELELVRDNVEEVIRLRQSEYNVTVSNCKTISGYVFYERKTTLTDDEKANLKQADLTKAFEFLNTNIVKIPRLTPFDPTYIKSISFSDRNILCIFKGKTLAKNEQYRAGSYHYDIETISSKVKSSLNITLNTDANNGNTTNPIDGNPITNPTKRPPSGNINPGNGGKWNFGNNSGSSTPSNKGSYSDDDDNIIRRDLNEDEEKESLETPSGDSCIIPKTNDDFVDLSEIFEFKDSEVVTTSDAIFTDESLVGIGGQGDGSVYLAKNYSGGYVWTYPTTGEDGTRHLGTIYTNDAILMPKIRTYVTVKAKYKIAGANGNGKDSSGSKVLATFMFWQYAQPFVLVTNNSDGSKTETQISGGDTSTFFPSVSDIAKLSWNNHNDDNPTLTEDDIVLNYNGDPNNLSIKIKWRWDSIGLEPNEGKISIKDIVNICAYTNGMEVDELKQKYNIPETTNDFKVTTATNNNNGTILDTNNFNIKFNEGQNDIGFELNFADTSKKALYGWFDFTSTITDVNGNTFTSAKATNYDIRYTRGNRYVYFNTSDIIAASSTFDYTQIKKVEFNVIEVRDFKKNIVQSTGDINENT